MVGSSTDPEASLKKEKLYQFTITLVTKTRGSHGHEGMPVLLNTWGDAIVAVYGDCQIAWEAIQELLLFCSAEDIQIRIGVSYGAVELKINPILGIDVVGKTVELAARLEASKDNPGLLTCPSFKSQISIHQLLPCDVELPKGFNGGLKFKAFT